MLKLTGLTASILSVAIICIGRAPDVAAQERQRGEQRSGRPQPQGQPPAQPQAQPQARPQSQARPQPQQRYVPPRHEESRRRGPDGRAIAGGIAAGVIGAIILNEAVRARRDRGGAVEIIEEAPRLSCQRLADRCEDGERWACRRLERECEEE